MSSITFLFVFVTILTLIILLFLLMNKEWLSMGTVLVQIIFEN
jgi:NADH-ubiquinone oxidoreductase chain 2